MKQLARTMREGEATQTKLVEKQPIQKWYSHGQQVKNSKRNSPGALSKAMSHGGCFVVVRPAVIDRSYSY